MNNLLKHVDKSIYSLSDWQEAINAFQLWLKENNRTLDDKNMIGYISCCAEAGGKVSPSPELKEQVMEMLQMYGFEQKHL